MTPWSWRAGDREPRRCTRIRRDGPTIHPCGAPLQVRYLPGGHAYYQCSETHLR